jgi:predicted DCC family thiol-disulfide oxidoreductase YuxK
MDALWQPRAIDGTPNRLILFDGVCVLCSRWVQFVLARDDEKLFLFTPIQSPYGQALAKQLGINALNPETNAVITNGIAYFKFDTVIEVLQKFPRWSWVTFLRFLPRRLRNWLYDRVAQNRYSIFGRMETCLVPKPDYTTRFIFDLPRADEWVTGSSSLAQRERSAGG